VRPDVFDLLARSLPTTGPQRTMTTTKWCVDVARKLAAESLQAKTGRRKNCNGNTVASSRGTDWNTLGKN